MATGIEIAGLALAALPLLIESAKAYGRGVHTARNYLSNSRRDAALYNDYEKLGFELYFLKKQLRDLVIDLPLCADCRDKLLDGEDLGEWENNAAIRNALLEYLDHEEESFQAFVSVLRRILRIVDQLFNDSAFELSNEEKVGSYR